jgi:hypothetical protein
MLPNHKKTAFLARSFEKKLIFSFMEKSEPCNRGWCAVFSDIPRTFYQFRQLVAPPPPPLPPVGTQQLVSECRAVQTCL